MAISSTPVEEAAVATLQGAVASGEIAREPARLDGVKLVALIGGAAVVWLAVSVPYLSQRPVTGLGLAAITLLAAIWIVTLRSAFAAGKGTIGTGLSAAIGCATGLVIAGAIDPWFPGLQLGPVGLVGIGAGVFATASIWEWFVRQTSVGRTSVLVVGTEELATGIAEEMRRARSGFHLLGRIGACRSSETGDVPCLGGLPELAQVVEAQRPDIVVLTDEASYKLVVDRLLDVSGAGFRIAGLATFFEYAFGRVPLPHVTPAWFMGVLHLRQHVYARWSKRAFDILVASIGLLLVAPLLPVIAFLVWRTDGPTDLPADAARRGRAPVHGLQVPDDGLRCGGSRPAAVGNRVRPAGHADRALPPPDSPGRDSSALERPQGRHVDGGAAAGAPRVRADARGLDAVLEPSAADQAGGHRLGADLLRLCSGL